MNGRLSAAALTIMICSTQAWAQEGLLENSNSPRGRAIARSGTGVGLAAPTAPSGGVTGPAAMSSSSLGMIGTTVGTTAGTTVGTTRGATLGTIAGQ